MPLPLLAMGLGAGLGAIGNMFSASAQADAINKRITAAQELAARNLVSQDEISDRLSSIDRMFNQRLTSVLNTTAIRSRGFANRGTIGAAAAGQVEGARLTAQDTAITHSQDVNRNIRNQIAQLELGKQDADLVGAAFSGAAAGIPLANEAMKGITFEGVGDNPFGGAQAGQGINPGMTGPQVTGGGFNPFMQSNAPRLGTFGTQNQVPTQNPFGGQTNIPNFNFLPNVTGGF